MEIRSFRTQACITFCTLHISCDEFCLLFVRTLRTPRVYTTCSLIFVFQCTFLLVYKWNFCFSCTYSIAMNIWIPVLLTFVMSHFLAKHFLSSSLPFSILLDLSKNSDHRILCLWWNGVFLSAQFSDYHRSSYGKRKLCLSRNFLNGIHLWNLNERIQKKDYFNWIWKYFYFKTVDYLENIQFISKNSILNAYNWHSDLVLNSNYIGTNNSIFKKKSAWTIVKTIRISMENYQLESVGYSRYWFVHSLLRCIFLCLHHQRHLIEWWSIR